MVSIVGDRSYVRLSCKLFSLCFCLFLSLASLLLLYVCLSAGKKLFLLVCLEVLVIDCRLVLICSLLSLSLCLFRLLLSLSRRCICLNLRFGICNCLLICIVCCLIEVLGMVSIVGDRSYVRLSCKLFSLCFCLFLSLASLLLLYVCLSAGKKLFLLVCLEVVVIDCRLVLICSLLNLSLCLFRLARRLRIYSISLSLSFSLFLSFAFSISRFLVVAFDIICIVFRGYICSLLISVSANVYRNKYSLGRLGVLFVTS